MRGRHKHLVHSRLSCHFVIMTRVNVGLGNQCEKGPNKCPPPKKKSPGSLSSEICVLSGFDGHLLIYSAQNIVTLLLLHFAFFPCCKHSV